MKLILCAAALALVTGCAAPQAPLNTRSGKPEIFIEGVTRQQVADELVDSLSGQGLTMRTVSDYQIVAGQLAGDLGARVLHGSRYDSVPEYRLSYTMVELPGGVRVYGRAAIVTNPGSGFERVNDMTERVKHDVQDMLNRLRSQLK